MIRRFDPDHRFDLMLLHVQLSREFGRYRLVTADVNFHRPELRIKPKAKVQERGR